ncbi:MAG: hypothetical protein QOI31_1188, partial [Solirubrobacterales bacterium]|nr:hypothetical protein [Solirubrobacterales bacterium]
MEIETAAETGSDMATSGTGMKINVTRDELV